MAQLFIYTRTSHYDYRALYAPSNDFCDLATYSFFKNQARGLINTDNYEWDGNPRWIISQKAGMVLCGVGCWNQELSPENNNADEVGTPVRGFFGFICDKAEKRYLLNSMAFYQSIYSKYIVPQWNAKVNHYDICEIIDLPRIDYSFSSTIISNYNVSIIRVHNTIEFSDAFCAINKSIDDITFAFGLNSVEHACNPNYLFTNVSCINYSGQQDFRDFEIDTNSPTDSEQHNFDNRVCRSINTNNRFGTFVPFGYGEHREVQVFGENNQTKNLKINLLESIIRKLNRHKKIIITTLILILCSILLIALCNKKESCSNAKKIEQKSITRTNGCNTIL